MTKLIQTHAVICCLLAGCSSSAFSTDGADAGDATHEGASEGGTEAAVDGGVDGCQTDTFINCGPCPSGYSETTWLRDNCTDDGGAHTTWECTLNCGVFVKCNPGLGCPDGWLEDGDVYTELCGSNTSVLNGVICSPQ